MILNGTTSSNTIFRPINGLRLRRLLRLKRYLTFGRYACTSVRLFGIFRNSNQLSKIYLMNNNFIYLLNNGRLICLYLSSIIFCLFRRRFKNTRLVSNERRINISRLYPIGTIRIRRLTGLLTTRKRRQFRDGNGINSRLRQSIRGNNCTLRIYLNGLPQLNINGMFISSTNGIRHFLLYITRFRCIRRLLRFYLSINGFFRHLTIMIIRFTYNKRCTIRMLLNRLRNTIRRITVGNGRLIIVAYLRILPNRIIIFYLQYINNRRMTRRVLLTKRIGRVLIRPCYPIT